MDTGPCHNVAHALVRAAYPLVGTPSQGCIRAAGNLRPGRYWSFHDLIERFPARPHFSLRQRGAKGSSCQGIRAHAYKCRYCEKQLTQFTATLDHVRAVAEGGDNSFDNSRKRRRPVGDFLAES
jgi:hypothetical protein